MAKDKTYRLKVTFLDDGETAGTFTLAQETDWSVFQESVLEIKDASGLKAYFPISAVVWEII